VKHLRLQVLDFLDRQMRPGQMIPEGLNLVFEINNVRMQRITHGFREYLYIETISQ
jgi:hypothetical protein